MVVVKHAPMYLARARVCAQPVWLGHVNNVNNPRAWILETAHSLAHPNFRFMTLSTLAYLGGEVPK